MCELNSGCYEIEYFDIEKDYKYATIVHADSFTGAIFNYRQQYNINTQHIMSIRLLDETEIRCRAKCKMNSLYGQAVKKSYFTELAEKIEKNEKRINELEAYYNRLNARLNELWDKFNALKEDHEE